MWYGGTLTRVASVSGTEANSTEPKMYAARLRCRSTALFGAAVVPLVISSTATASGSTSGIVSASTGGSSSSSRMPTVAADTRSGVSVTTSGVPCRLRTSANCSSPSR
jgi:hypothetical protein